LIGDRFRASVEKHLRPYLMEVFSAGPRILLSGLGEDAVTTGALLLAGTQIV